MVRARGRASRRSHSVTVNGLVVTDFSQSLGAELLANADFASWSSDNPTGWSVSGETGGSQQVTQTAPDGSAGSGAARFESSASGNPRIDQTPVTSGQWYEGVTVLSAYTSGTAQSYIGGKYITLSAVQTQSMLVRAGSANVTVTTSGAVAHDFVIDSVSVKKITLNPVWTGLADGTQTFSFTLPSSPHPGQRLEMRYRQQDDLNYWAAVIVRNSANTGWDFQLNSVSAGTATNRISVTGVGTPDAVRVIVSGSSHTAQTGSSGTFTQRGSTVTVTHLNTQTGITAVYNSPITPVQLSSQ